MSYTQGGGGSPVYPVTENSRYGLSKPGDVSGLPLEQGFQLIDEMFEQLYRGTTRAETDITTVTTRVDGLESSPWTLVTKPETESRVNTTTYATDTDLTFPVESGAVYVARIHVFGGQTGTGTADLKVRLNTTATFSKTIIRQNTGASQQLTLPSTQVNLATTATDNEVQWNIMITTTSAGNVYVDWAGINLHATDVLNIYAGSFLEYMRVEN